MTTRFRRPLQAAFVNAQPKRPPHPALNVRDDAYAPLVEAGRIEIAGDLARSGSQIFLRSGLDRPNHVEMALKIGFYAQGILAALTDFKANARAKNEQRMIRCDEVFRLQTPPGPKARRFTGRWTSTSPAVSERSEVLAADHPAVPSSAPPRATASTSIAQLAPKA